MQLGFFFFSPAVISAPLGVSSGAGMHVLHFMVSSDCSRKELAILWQGKGFLFLQKGTSLSERRSDIYHFYFAEIVVLWRAVSSCGLGFCP